MVDVKTVTLDGKAWFKTQELADRWDCSVRKVRLMIERGDIALGVPDLAHDAEKLGGGAFAGDGGVDFAVIVK